MTNTPGPLWPLILPQDQHGLDSMCTVSAKGVRVRFADGAERLCGTSGLWNTNLGYGNEAIADAVAAALREASYLSAWGYENVYARRAAELIDLAGPDRYARVLFSTAGGAANDMAMKLVRHYQVLADRPHCAAVLGLRDGFHGMTFGAFALTDAQLGQRMYGVDRRKVGHVPANDTAALESALSRLDGQVAAVFVEPVLGTGAVPLTEEYIADLLRLRREHDFLLVVDEVSTGFGRIGNEPFESGTWPEGPDVLISAKGLTNGTLPASAVLVSHRVAEAFTSTNSVLGHAETQAGTSVVCAAISATIAETRRLEVLARSAKMSSRLDVELENLVERNAMVDSTSGAGCLRAVRLQHRDGRTLAPAEVSGVVAAVRQAGALVHPGPSCVQLLPALIYSDEDLDELLRRVDAGVTAYARESADGR